VAAPKLQQQQALAVMSQMYLIQLANSQTCSIPLESTGLVAYIILTTATQLTPAGTDEGCQRERQRRVWPNDAGRGASGDRQL